MTVTSGSPRTGAAYPVGPGTEAGLHAPDLSPTVQGVLQRQHAAPRTGVGPPAAVVPDDREADDPTGALRRPEGEVVLVPAPYSGRNPPIRRKRRTHHQQAPDVHVGQELVGSPPGLKNGRIRRARPGQRRRSRCKADRCAGRRQSERDVASTPGSNSSPSSRKARNAPVAWWAAVFHASTVAPPTTETLGASADPGQLPAVALPIGGTLSARSPSHAW